MLVLSIPSPQKGAPLSPITRILDHTPRLEICMHPTRLVWATTKQALPTQLPSFFNETTIDQRATNETVKWGRLELHRAGEYLAAEMVEFDHIIGWECDRCCV